MGDHTSETLRQLQIRQDDEAYARDRFFVGHHFGLYDDSIPWILNHIDCFVSQSRGNESVKVVYLWPHAFHGHDEDGWHKVGQAVGNLQSLETLYISPLDRTNGPDWGERELACILSRVRPQVKVELNGLYQWPVGEVQTLARAIRGHPTIASFYSCNNLPYESTDVLYSALATLPALETIRLSIRGLETQSEAESTLAHPQSLTELLCVPTLRFVWFDRFSFTRALCQATANALTEGTAVTKLKFNHCSFPAQESAAIMASGLGRNTSVVSVSVVGRWDVALIGALAAALPSNSTLRELSFRRSSDNVTNNVVHLSPVFSALGQNTGLKDVSLNWSGSMDESLCTAMTDGLSLNETLESMKLTDTHICDDTAAFWCRTLSFLRTNKTLKALVVDVHRDVTESCLIAFRIDTAAMLQENTSLESLSIRKSQRNIIKAEEMIALVTALQYNTTLKTLSLDQSIGRLQLTDDEDKQMASLLRKNYALESLPDIDLEDRVGDAGAILRLNAAGRRYLIQDGSFISKGVDVLSRVNNDINCALLHLLENPILCDRGAVEMTTPIAGESDGRSMDPTASSGGGGKREQASAHNGKEPRRRLA
jgi:hypothetical protein